MPADAPAELVDALAADYAAAVPGPAAQPPAVPVELMDRLLGDRFSPAQRRCLHRIRELL